MRAPTYSSLAAAPLAFALSLLLCACLPEGSTGKGSDAATSADSSSRDSTEDSGGSCRDDYDCGRLTICRDGACVAGRCTASDPAGQCGQDPSFFSPRGCYLPTGTCSPPECTGDAQCWVKIADGALSEGDSACVFGVCQPPL